MSTVRRITRAEVDTYPDTGQSRVHMEGELSDGKPWSFWGSEGNAHTEALLDRFEREGGQVIGVRASRRARAHLRRRPRSFAQQMADLDMAFVRSERRRRE